MDSFEFNKIAGAVLAALLVIFGTKEILLLTGVTGGSGHGTEQATAGFKLPAPEKTAAAGKGAAAPAAPKGFDAKAIVVLLGKADAQSGKAAFKKCKACHTSKSGGASRVGPNLWNIVNRNKGSVAGFKYSKALIDKGGAWNYEDLALFLHKPKTYLPGTKMSFAGFKSDKDLANIVVYLRSLADSPAPLPQ